MLRVGGVARQERARILGGVRGEMGDIFCVDIFTLKEARRRFGTTFQLPMTAAIPSDTRQHCVNHLFEKEQDCIPDLPLRISAFAFPHCNTRPHFCAPVSSTR